jgi:DNA-binding transcriptional ArsR family regulator
MSSAGPSHHYTAVATTLGAIGSHVRLEILDLVGTERVSVHEIAGRVGMLQPTVTMHLKVFLLHQLIIGRREGQKVFYRLTERGQTVIEMVRALERRV